MKILYRQPELCSRHSPAPLDACGVRQCYLKELSARQDKKNVTLKAHHHTGFEIHMVMQGCETYEAEGRIFHVKVGELLLIPPGVIHRVCSTAPDTRKHSLSFSAEPGSALSQPLSAVCRCVYLPAPPQLEGQLRFIAQERQNRTVLSPTLVENRVMELLVTLLRACGMKEQPAPAPGPDGDARLLMAKQYAADNTEQALRVSELAAYCHISTKQLTRLFLQFEGITPAEYIARRRVRRIEELLSESELPLRRISEQMHFSSEYYFSTFFKRRAGMTPGAYRNMHRGQNG